MCDGKTHTACPVCNIPLCSGDHSGCQTTSETCPVCGKDATDGEHGFCSACNSRLCDGRDHSVCPVCNIPLCSGDHSGCQTTPDICPGCGLSTADGGVHGRCTIGDCTGYVCDGQSHSECGTCYGCMGDGNPDHMNYCMECGQPLCNKELHLMCGKCPYCMQDKYTGDHSYCDGCGSYLCVATGVDHSYCEGCNYRKCSSYTTGSHERCTHCDGWLCVNPDSHHECPSCDGYYCDGKNHGPCEYCSNTACIGEHGICSLCGGHVCQTAGGIEHAYCPNCGVAQCTEFGQHIVCPDCGNRYCDGRNHYRCEYCYKALCIGDHTDCAENYCKDCHHLLNERDHSYCTECGLRHCNGKEHTECPTCGNYQCIPGTNHRVCDGCGERYCNGATHRICDYCGHRFCEEGVDHTRCTPDYCSVCHELLSEGDHNCCPDCGEYRCVSDKNHDACSFCGGALCTGNHQYCGLRPESPVKACPACGEEGDEHATCPWCYAHVCAAKHDDCTPEDVGAVKKEDFDGIYTRSGSYMETRYWWTEADIGKYSLIEVKCEWEATITISGDCAAEIVVTINGSVAYHFDCYFDTATGTVVFIKGWIDYGDTSVQISLVAEAEGGVSDTVILYEDGRFSGLYNFMHTVYIPVGEDGVRMFF